MTLLVDRRIGSMDLFPVFQDMGLPSLLTTLEYGDCAWTGLGTDGPVNCGVEVKRLDDLLQSMQSGRLAGHQLPGLLNTYDRVYLIVEEVIRPGESGALEHYVKGKWWHQTKLGRANCPFTFRACQKYLTSLVEQGDVRLWPTVNRRATAETIATLYQWWVDGYDAHSSILALDKTTQIRLAEKMREEHGGGVSLLRTGPSFKRRIAAELPGVGVDRSKQVSESFRSVAEMIAAGEKRWMQVKGIGKGLAKQIVEAIKKEGG